MRYGMVIDLNRCIGCHACSVACKIENRTAPGVFWSRVFQAEDGIYPNVRRSHIPRLCMHCVDPSCLTVCPTKATYKDEKGLVLVDYDKCIGCKACILACPYEARDFNEGGEYFGKAIPWGENVRGGRVGTAEKCTFCAHLIGSGEEPACVTACLTEARFFGDLDDPDSRVSRLIKTRFGFQFHPEFNTRPSVYYLPPKGSILGVSAYRFDSREGQE